MNCETEINLKLRNPTLKFTRLSRWTGNRKETIRLFESEFQNWPNHHISKCDRLNFRMPSKALFQYGAFLIHRKHPDTTDFTLSRNFQSNRFHMHKVLHLALLTLGIIDPSLVADDDVQSLNQFVESNCLDCHSGSSASGGFDFSKLSHEFSDAEVHRRWVLVHDRLESGEMPPEDAEHPTEASRKSMLTILRKKLDQADQSKSGVVLRRLNRYEYQNTVNDLFSIDVQIIGLPQDASTDGFDTVGEGLAVSAEAMQAYLEAADQVLDAVFGPAIEPKRILHETNLLKQVDWKGRPQLDSQIGKMFRKTKDGLVIFQSGYCPTNLVNFARLRAPAGTYRGTIKVRAIQSKQPVTLRIYGGDTIVNRRERHLVGYYDVPPEWTTIEFVDRLVEDGGTFQPKCYGTRDTRKDADTYPEPGIEIGDIVIEGPLEQWPPASRTLLLGDVDVKSAKPADAKKILAKVLPLAFRRPIESTEVLPFVALYELATSDGRSFEDAIRVALKAVLCSPDFLFLHEPSESMGSDDRNEVDLITTHALASRLSYFLWSSMPDEKLRRLADDGTLRQPKVLRNQVERMLLSPKATAFVRNFTGQWLSLRDINFTEPDANLFPEFDELLRNSMLKETEEFFEEILRNDLPITNFVNAEFTFLNQRLAGHYGIDGVEGQQMRKVRLPTGHIRGGLLTQASILKVTANGTYSSPVQRGVWILNNILGAPTSPPPDNVGSVEPDIRGATTIREQLNRHRNIESCAACHRKIDPPGFALECFDPIGGFRTNYRTMAETAKRPSIKQAPFTYAWVRYRIGLEVDNSLSDNADHQRKLGDVKTLSENVRDFRESLASRPNDLARTLSKKLLTYALGRKMGFSDRTTIDRIVRQSGDENYGFRSLIHSVVQNRSFQRP